MGLPAPAVGGGTGMQGSGGGARFAIGLQRWQPPPRGHPKVWEPTSAPPRRRSVREGGDEGGGWGCHSTPGTRLKPAGETAGRGGGWLGADGEGEEGGGNSMNFCFSCNVKQMLCKSGCKQAARIPASAFASIVGLRGGGGGSRSGEGERGGGGGITAPFVRWGFGNISLKCGSPQS